MFAGTDCPRNDMPDPQSQSIATLCHSCVDSATEVPNPSPVSSLAGFVGLAFNSTLELVSAVDAYMLDSSDSSDTALLYGHPIGNWDVRQLSNFSSVFSARWNPDMLFFNEDLSAWDVSNAVTMHAMFEATVSFTGGDSLAQWNVAHVVDLSRMFAASSFAGDVSQWSVDNVRDFSFLAHFAVNFQSDVSTWNVGSAENMGWMFRGAKSFASNVSTWNVANVVDFTSMFAGASRFVIDLCAWGDLVHDDAVVRTVFAATNCPIVTEPMTLQSSWCTLCDE